ncbi:MAG: SlyX family protein [Gammaproteobacteria bacterium]|nr:SlyX family protein [Gammaproteobacteria bacterium]
MEDRLIELETRLAFQDHVVQQLNDTIVRQQRDLDGLRRDIEMLRNQLAALAPALVENRSDETPPPHY